MKVYLDSSSFAKRFVDEEGSVEVETVCSQASALGLSVIGIPEVVSADDRQLKAATKAGLKTRQI